MAKLLSGGNPQIPKGYGEAPVRAWLDTVPGWKQAVCRRIDQIVAARSATTMSAKAESWAGRSRTG